MIKILVLVLLRLLIVCLIFCFSFFWVVVLVGVRFGLCNCVVKLMEDWLICWVNWMFCFWLMDCFVDVWCCWWVLIILFWVICCSYRWKGIGELCKKFCKCWFVLIRMFCMMLFILICCWICWFKWICIKCWMILWWWLSMLLMVDGLFCFVCFSSWWVFLVFGYIDDIIYEDGWRRLIVKLFELKVCLE